MTATSIVPSLKAVTGKPTATLFVEPGVDRHFIAEITFGAVVMYLAGKYLDGFIEGLGIADLGKRHGGAISRAISSLLSIIRGDTADEEREKELLRQEGILQTVVQQLAEHAGNRTARQEAERAVRQLLEEKGLPPSEAQRIASAIGTKLVGAADG